MSEARIEPDTMTGEALTVEMRKIAEQVARALDEIPTAFDAKRKRRERLEDKITVALRSTYRFAELQGGELGIMIGARDAAVRARTNAAQKIEAAAKEFWLDRLLSRLGLIRMSRAREGVRSVPVPPTLPALAVAMARRMRDDAKKRAAK